MASLSFVFFLLLISLASTGRTQSKQPSHITTGLLLYPTTHPTSWLSPSGRFAFGFYQNGSDGFAVGIWLVEGDKRIVVWTAFRDDPPLTSNVRLDFTKEGRLLLRTERGQEKLIADATAAAAYASMLDSGNFVLYDKDSKIIWQSFEHPTDTILGGQTLFPGGRLVSSLTGIDHSTERFHLEMQSDGNLVLYPANTANTPVDAYWSTDTYLCGSKCQLYLNNAGLLAIFNGTSLLKVCENKKGKSYGGSNNNTGNTIYRATLDSDGNFRLYSHAYDDNGNFKVSNSVWEALTDLCQVNSFCGFNSYCTFDDVKPYCVCLPGTKFVGNSSRDCVRNFWEAGCRGGKEINTAYYTIETLTNMQWGDHPYAVASMSEEECKRSCLEECNCGAALFDNSKSKPCSKHSLPLIYVRRADGEKGSSAFLKVGTETVQIPTETVQTPKKPLAVLRKTTIVQILLMTFGLTVFSVVSLSISGLFIIKSRVLRYKRLLENGHVGPAEEITLRLFSYNELKRVTNGFKEEIGKGSFGAVYKGALYKAKKLVAVKRLEKLIEEGEREFRAEMRAIGRTHHRNLVRLLGYCAEGSKRLLVYEYMSNGSLADLLFRAPMRPDWNERVRIAQDVARGILYLHEECENPIIHCDIKPQNILMDEFWTAKISDFGLAKLLMPDQTRTFTGVRGTRGYLAPEWQKNIPISVKADVYSYGIMLFEIVCCRRSIELHNISSDDEIILSSWVYQCFLAGELDKIVRWEAVDKTTLENMIKAGLWCIQDEPALRPSMKSVLLMLEGITDVSVPPCPTAYTTT